MLFFFNINPKILSQLAQVLFDPAAFLLVINMRDCNLTKQDTDCTPSCSVFSPPGGQLQDHLVRIITAVWRVLALLTSLSSPECDDGERSVRLVRPPLPDICPPEVVGPD